MPMLFSPTIGAANSAGYWFLWVRCPACRTINVRLALLRLYVGRPDYLRPLLGFVSDEFAEIGGRAHKYCAAQVGEPRLEFGIGKARVDFLVEPVDDFSRRVLRCTDALPSAHFIAGHKFVD